MSKIDSVTTAPPTGYDPVEAPSSKQSQPSEPARTTTDSTEHCEPSSTDDYFFVPDDTIHGVLDDIVRNGGIEAGDGQIEMIADASSRIDGDTNQERFNSRVIDGVSLGIPHRQRADAVHDFVYDNEDFANWSETDRANLEVALQGVMSSRDDVAAIRTFRAEVSADAMAEYGFDQLDPEQPLTRQESRQLHQDLRAWRHDQEDRLRELGLGNGDEEFEYHHDRMEQAGQYFEHVMEGRADRAMPYQLQEPYLAYLDENPGDFYGAYELVRPEMQERSQARVNWAVDGNIAPLGLPNELE